MEKTRRNPSERWARTARKEVYTIKPGRTLRLYHDAAADEPLNPATTAYFLVRAIKHYYGIKRQTTYKLAKRRFMKDNMYAPCYRCGMRLTGWMKRHHGLAPLSPTDVTIDHIIPLWVVYLLELPSLEFDRRNFAVCCGPCNQKRGHELVTIGAIRKELGDVVVDRLFEKAGASYPDEYHFFHAQQ